MDFSEEVLIQRPRAAVADYLFNASHDPEWMPALTEVRWLVGPPLQVGSRIARIARFLGKRMEYVLDVTAFEANQRLEMFSSSGPFPMTVSYELTDEGTATRFRLRTQGDPRGFFKLAAPLLKKQVQRQIKADLQRLKQRLEVTTVTP